MDSGGESQRWQGQRSSFPWEQEALDYIKSLMPETEPYRARQTFTFTARGGHVREVDLLIVTPGGLFLVEIKSHPGTATNNGSTWMFRDAGKLRTIENPLHFTDQKCKELKEQLQRAAGQSVRVPRIEPVVFLSATNLVCRFDDFQKQGVYGRDDRTAAAHLGGIWTDFLNQPPVSERNRVTPTFSRQLPRLLEAIGIARVHRAGKVGPYELEPKAFDSGPTWADYLASNPSLPSDHARRVRIYLSERTASDADRASVQRAAYREYMALQGISHDGIVRAEQYSDELLAGPAVVFRHGKNWQRLDQFMAAATSTDNLPLETRLDMIRQLGEALEHAHRSRLHHRALAPRSVYVEMDGRYPRLRIADWQVAARPHGTTTSTSHAASAVSPATTGLGRHVELSAGPYLAPEFAKDDAVAALLDVFSLGAVSYLILTGTPPAASRAELASKLSSEHALVPSAVADSVSPAMDDLISGATQVSAADRTESVRQFLRQLDAIEDELTTPDMPADIDPLTAGRGDEINGWTVDRVLGKGSTSRAFFVRKDGARRVYKVAVSESAARRLEAEAAQLDQLLDSHVARLLEPPFLAGPKDKQRTVIGVEYIEGDTLAEEISRQGPLAIHELERLGEDLFQALKFLDRRQVWHRDIKPDNLILRELDRKGRELVLIDFSLAGIPDSDIHAGTRAYLDPFLGEASKGRRQRYDQAAELYAVAVTLHEMASGELPTWGDDMADPAFLDPGEEVQLSADLFDPVARDNLEAFFRVALARNVSDRFSSLQEMTHAWIDVFRDLETVPPLTTAATEDGDEQASTSEDHRTGTARQPEQDRAARARAASAKRTEASRTATPATPLAAAGLSPYALSAALQKLRVSTAGELAAIPAAKITRLRGIGSVPRYELVRLARDWRQRFTPDVQWTSGAEHGPVAEVTSPELAAGPAEEDLAHLSVDAVVRLLVPGSQELARVVGLAVGTGGVASPWAGQREIARVTGLAETDVAAYLDRLRNRWAKSVPALLLVRNDLVQILEEHGRILGWRQLAAGLLARRGSELADAAERIRLAAICVRAAVETEERLNSARLSSRRLPGKDGERVLIALTGVGEVPAPRADELFAFAEMLGEEADALADRDPLPSVAEIKQVLREVPTADNATRLSDTDLVLLAAAASQKTAATPRLELYPRDLPPLRAVKISQAGSIAEGAFESELVRRVLARFPDLYEANRPKAADMPGLLGRLGYDVTRGSDSKLWVRSSTQLTSSRGSRVAAASEPKSALVEAIARAYRRLSEARTRGGFIALKVPLRDAARIADHVAAMDGVTGVNVTATFTRLLRELVEEQGRPRWETVLAADSPDASPAARNGFGELLSKTWERLDAYVRAVGAGGIVALHDATPLARYTGGPELLARLTVAARDASEAPLGLWLVCPMENPQGSPLLDRRTVSVIPGDAEQLYVPEGFGSSGKGLLAS